MVRPHRYDTTSTSLPVQTLTHPACVMSLPSAQSCGDRSPHAALHELLVSANLLTYEQALLQHGADDVIQLRELDESVLSAVCEAVGLNHKPLHLLRFKKALGRDADVSVLLRATAPATGAKEGNGLDVSSFTRRQPEVHAMSANTPRSTSQNGSALVRNITTPAASTNYSTPQQTKQHGVAIVADSLTSQSYNFGLVTTSGGTTSATDTQFSSTSSSSFGGLFPQSSVYPHTADDVEGDPNPQGSGSPNTKFCLPAYLHPKSNTSDFSELVDESTPIQMQLGVCPVLPQMWDPKRLELIHKAAAIYGQRSNQRKTAELTSHEMNVNEAAAQLCLRDPTLLARRDELFILSRRAVREGGFSYVHGFSRSKQAVASGDTGAEGRREEEGGSSQTTVREKRKQRLEELERLISKNKEEQKAKIAALEQAHAIRDFSHAYQLQTELEALGNVCLTLETEYTQLKRRQKRSDRYFENKAKRPATDPSLSSVSTVTTGKFESAAQHGATTLSQPQEFSSSFVIALPPHHYRSVIFPTSSSSPVNSMISLATETADSNELAEQFLVQPQNLATRTPQT